MTSDARGPAFPPLATDGPAVDPYTRPPYEPPSLPAERDVVHSLSDTEGSDDTTTPAAPAERDEPVRTWFRDDCSCPVTDRNGDLCALSTDTTRRLCDHCEAHEAATPSVETLAEAIHYAMCDVSHHDRFTVCKNQRKYELVAESVSRRLSPPTDTGAER